MTKHKTISFEKPDQFLDPLHELIHSDAKQLIQSAVECELQSLLDQFQNQYTESGQPTVVRNGYSPERKLQTGIGPVPVRIPKVRSRTG